MFRTVAAYALHSQIFNSDCKALCAEKNFCSRTAPQRSQFTAFSTVPTAHEAHQTSHIAGFSVVSRGRLCFISHNSIFPLSENRIHAKLDLIWYRMLRATQFYSVNSEKYDKGLSISLCHDNPYPTAFPYGNGMVLHFYQQQENSTTKTVHKVINKGLKAYV